MIRFYITVLLCNFFVTGSGQVIEDTNASVRPVSGAFSTLNVSGNVRVIVSQSGSSVLAVSAEEEKYKDNIKTSVKDGVLHIDIDEHNIFKSRSRGYTVYVSLAALQHIEASGAADIVIAGTLTQNNMVVQLSGASTLAGKITAKTISLKLEGASVAKLIGTTHDLEITCNGASDVKFFELITQNCVANANGASDMQIAVQQKLQASASGASHIFYKGDVANTNVQAHGISKIEKKN